MPWYVSTYAWLVQSTVSSLLVLLAATVAIALTRQPARRIRIIELALAGLLVVPLLGALPGYPRWSLLPVMVVEQPEQQRGEVISSLVTPLPEPHAAITALPQVAETFSSTPEEPIVSELPSSAPDVVMGAADVDLPAAFEQSATPGFVNDYRFWIVAGYLAIAGALALWSLVGMLALWRLLRAARPADSACRELLRQIAGTASDRVALAVSPLPIQPCAVAWRPTTIVLDEALCRPDARRQLQWVLSHEWSHVAHGDVWAWSLSSLVRCLYFHQPLVWLLRRQLRVAQDFVADAAAAGESAEDYAEFLATRAAGFPNSPLAAGLGIGGHPSDLRRRVIMLVERTTPLETASPRRWNLVALPIGILLCALVAGLGQRTSSVAAAAPEAQEQPSAPAPETSPADASSNQPGPAETQPAPVQTGPRKLAVGDTLSIEVISNLAPDAGVRLLVPPTFTATVDEDGKVSLGGHYEAALVAGKSLRDVEQQIAKSLQRGIERDIKLKQLHDEGFAAPAGPVQINVRVALAQAPRAEVPGGPAPRAFWQGPDSAKAGPRHIAAGDTLQIELANEDLAMVGVRPVVIVEPDGNVALGALHGRVNLLGKSLAEAEKPVRLRLAQKIKDPNVQITYRQPHDADADRMRKLEQEISELKALLQKSKTSTLPTGGAWRSPREPAAPLQFSLRRDRAQQVVLYLGEEPVDDDTALGKLLAVDEAEAAPAVLIRAERGIPYGEVVKTIDRLAQFGVKRVSLDTQHAANEVK